MSWKDWRRCDTCGGWTRQPQNCLNCQAKLRSKFDQNIPGIGKESTPGTAPPRNFSFGASFGDSVVFARSASAGGPIGGPLDGADELDLFVAWARALPERTPQVKWWSGMCLWCAREIREQSGDEHTHMPVLSTIQTCYRHRKALLGLSRWLRNEAFGASGGDVA